jgi:hypothetical protein
MQWQRILFMTIYTIIMIGLLIFRVIQYYDISRIANGKKILFLNFLRLVGHSSENRRNVAEF